MVYIGAHGVAALHRHKYSGVDHSLLAKYVLQPFWTRCVNLFPLWMPGYACAKGIYSPQLDSPPPRWVNFAHGLFLFLYQTFDAVDGKQARRTNSSSPLGELFDHGCDALGCAFEALAFGSTAMCGGGTFWFWFISAVPFYFATWEHYFTHTLILPAINGPTEGLMMIYMIHFFTAIVGAEWWVQEFGKSVPFLSWVPFLNEIVMYKAALYLMIIFAVIPTVWFNVHNVYKVVKARNGNMLLALAMLYPFIVLLGGVLAWEYLSPSGLMSKYPHLVVLSIGLAFGFLVGTKSAENVLGLPDCPKLDSPVGLMGWARKVWSILGPKNPSSDIGPGQKLAALPGRMILAHLCDEPKGLKTNMCMSLFYLPLGIANALTARLNDGVPLVDEFWVLLGFFAYTVALYMHFATSVIHEITTALGIYCFRITRKEA
ncbi:choline/ethanolaminephosphotransferase 1 [Phtheirospermum japonicum]|uniref:Choline/ethanolaminephosphotransferase 1 n=1 Tax=Phtheirospermum japonicum TaxID=374723 RepID=A0A830D0Q3_9LAMI|nr:choline/ethanolaminephosphotransferase 1 [Phtheirospermum japonicum]